MSPLTPAAVESRLRAFYPRSAGSETGRASAVAVVLLARDGVATHTVLTRRSTALTAHPGQWALPGGRLDPGESSEQGALRELEEELGLRIGADGVLGRLDDFVSQSGYRITPVVLWSEADPGGFDPDPAEVASVHLIALDELEVEIELVEDPGLPTPVLRLPFRGRFIHAPTGAFLHQLREVVLHGRPTRVHTFSTPRRLDRPVSCPDHH